MYKQIQEICKEKGISVMQLEKDLKYTRGCLYKWDKNRPSIDKVKAVADYFNVPIEYFLNEKGGTK